MMHFDPSTPLTPLRSLSFAVLLAAFSLQGSGSQRHPLEPPNRTSPRATLTTFGDSLDRAYALWKDGDPAFREDFLDARECLDLSDVAPLVLLEVSAESALLLKEIIDRIDPSSEGEVPDAAAVRELELTSWTIPHTQITLIQSDDGELSGQWLFSRSTVERADEFYRKIEHLPYLPGRQGGHIEELRTVSHALLLAKLVNAGPAWLRSEVGGMLVWQWLGLGTQVSLLLLTLLGASWLSRRWQRSDRGSSALARYVIPVTMIAVPIIGRFMIRRLFALPGEPAFMVRLGLSIIGYVGLIWLVAQFLTHLGEITVKLGFRDARPLKKQLVRVIFRITTIVVATIIGLVGAQRLGVPITGLIAGLGVGGLAIALAAQGTLENFIGGIILYADQPVRVGDICRFGGRRGTVEDVGLRSVRIRTFDRTLVTVPNADFAQLQLENFSERDQILLKESIFLRYETSHQQMAAVLSEITALLRDDVRIAEEPLRVRFIGIGSYALEIEVFAYAKTTEWPEFLEIRERILLEIMRIVDRSGTRLALPAEVHYRAPMETENGDPADPDAVPDTP